jgi:hypothetical protein
VDFRYVVGIETPRACDAQHADREPWQCRATVAVADRSTALVLLLGF